MSKQLHVTVITIIVILTNIRFMGLQSTSYDVEMERNPPKPFKLNSKVNIRHF